ncbi:UDP-2,4-diacetamido-2,4,6-trideoxy-beta-L-altropyranose hydrolase [Magnetospirillum sp. SS-4]|uniref:UDP-2,4-diacetamido-2,4, 6-trideoxy-beta-L-altropyranose hydrolase n=1 Tax=Magnetospirillum sp. SS-4 TaxID=2681465 RepID=UPI00137D7019|nr:UDP-2,4-diacetamido-2,4,6-trideoxy-beta-L-altropyranose hydrolase [Magnetospirillum sp. SS-4]CAA7623559.1 putative Pseudaminic acid biosynthesis-associated protein PseG [Magnetospirillum sp. SS-4]
MPHSRPSVVFRADASATIGTGHVMRCLALAEALRRRGFGCRLACAPETLRVVGALRNGPVDVAPLPEGCESEPAALMAAAAPPDWLVVDHYGLDESYEQALRGWAGRILVLDDLADRRHDCDLLLDQTPGREADRYAGLVPAPAMILAGPRHALLRPDFARLRGARPAAGRRLLVSLGGTDPTDATSVVLEAIAQARPDRPVTVVMGAAAPRLEQVRARAAALSPPADILVDVADMAALMAECDMAVGAAGTSALERCCLGLPTLLLVTADNQREVAAGLERAGAALACSLDATELARGLAALAGNDETRRAMAERAMALCDGLGTERLADCMNLTLRPATADDGEDLLAWRNDPDSRANSLDTAEVSRERHFDWLGHVLADPERTMLIGMLGGTKVGMARFDRCRPGEWRVSIGMAPTARGRGLGRSLLGFAIQALERRHGPGLLIADIRAANRPSRRIFTACGFFQTDEADGVIHVQRGGS